MVDLHLKHQRVHSQRISNRNSKHCSKLKVEVELTSKLGTPSTFTASQGTSQTLAAGMMRMQAEDSELRSLPHVMPCGGRDVSHVIFQSVGQQQKRFCLDCALEKLLDVQALAHEKEVYLAAVVDLLLPRLHQKGAAQLVARAKEGIFRALAGSRSNCAALLHAAEALGQPAVDEIAQLLSLINAAIQDHGGGSAKSASVGGGGSSGDGGAAGSPSVQRLFACLARLTALDGGRAASAALSASSAAHMVSDLAAFAEHGALSTAGHAAFVLTSAMAPPSLAPLPPSPPPPPQKQHQRWQQNGSSSDRDAAGGACVCGAAAGMAQWGGRLLQALNCNGGDSAGSMQQNVLALLLALARRVDETSVHDAFDVLAHNGLAKTICGCLLQQQQQQQQQQVGGGSDGDSDTSAGQVPLFAAVLTLKLLEAPHAEFRRTAVQARLPAYLAESLCRVSDRQQQNQQQQQQQQRAATATHTLFAVRGLLHFVRGPGWGASSATVGTSGLFACLQHASAGADAPLAAVLFELLPHLCHGSRAAPAAVQVAAATGIWIKHAQGSGVGHEAVVTTTEITRGGLCALAQVLAECVAASERQQQAPSAESMATAGAWEHEALRTVEAAAVAAGVLAATAVGQQHPDTMPRRAAVLLQLLRCVSVLAEAKLARAAESATANTTGNALRRIFAEHLMPQFASLEADRGTLPRLECTKLGAALFGCLQLLLQLPPPVQGSDALSVERLLRAGFARFALRLLVECDLAAIEAGTAAAAARKLVECGCAVLGELLEHAGLCDAAGVRRIPALYVALRQTCDPHDVGIGLARLLDHEPCSALVGLLFACICVDGTPSHGLGGGLFASIVTFVDNQAALVARMAPPQLLMLLQICMVVSPSGQTPLPAHTHAAIADAVHGQPGLGTLVSCCMATPSVVCTRPYAVLAFWARVPALHAFSVAFVANTLGTLARRPEASCSGDGGGGGGGGGGSALCDKLAASIIAAPEGLSLLTQLVAGCADDRLQQTLRFVLRCLELDTALGSGTSGMPPNHAVVASHAELAHAAVSLQRRVAASARIGDAPFKLLALLLRIVRRLLPVLAQCGDGGTALAQCAAALSATNAHCDHAARVPLDVLPVDFLVALLCHGHALAIQATTAAAPPAADCDGGEGGSNGDGTAANATPVLHHSVAASIAAAGQTAVRCLVECDAPAPELCAAALALSSLVLERGSFVARGTAEAERTASVVLRAALRSLRPTRPSFLRAVAFIAAAAAVEDCVRRGALQPARRHWTALLYFCCSAFCEAGGAAHVELRACAASCFAQISGIATAGAPQMAAALDAQVVGYRWLPFVVHRLLFRAPSLAASAVEFFRALLLVRPPWLLQLLATERAQERLVSGYEAIGGGDGGHVDGASRAYQRFFALLDAEPAVVTMPARLRARIDAAVTAATRVPRQERHAVVAVDDVSGPIIPAGEGRCAFQVPRWCTIPPRAPAQTRE